MGSRCRPPYSDCLGRLYRRPLSDKAAELPVGKALGETEGGSVAPDIPEELREHSAPGSADCHGCRGVRCEHDELCRFACLVWHGCRHGIKREPSELCRRHCHPVPETL